ncbi:class I SAM-dependent methyltransferase [Pseudoalteromonas sp. OOF1S-7]|uniref:class I SAM-dependent methyltransferase n=1 Tax=Pseudoalteromonas sp. OOF1S-7 TaxID=2917757 RepID=UPI001EF6BC46|nr:class I SAM-dependent methyltransferase [Pseudoalteromonas sp. OOF1S-7]MCG7537128.1 class I SAM-dependent methyltransferase [Pseudoalteromonas sp. OOF1S-7]
MAEDKFFGCGSSEYAKSRYVPVLEGKDIENLTLGKNTSAVFNTDPKMLGFSASKHKFVGKMFNNYDKVLEVGCMDGFGSAIVSSFVKNLVSIDYYKLHLEQAEKNIAPHFPNIVFKGHDILDGPVDGGFDGAYSLDVLEHIDPAQEDLYMQNVVASLSDYGTFIVGMPSLESQVYASEENKFAHINCKSAPDLHAFLSKYFRNVYAFGMNDEVLHTGYSPMCQYIINICSVPIR